MDTQSKIPHPSALAKMVWRLLATTVSLSSQSTVSYWVMFHTNNLLWDSVY